MRTTVALALAALSLGALGGCSMSSSSSPSPSSTAGYPGGSAILEQDRRDHVFHADLTTAPAPSVFGLSGDAPSAIVDRGTGDLLDVDLTLPEGGRLQAQAFQVSIGYVPLVDDEIVVSTYLGDVDAARTRLAQDTESLGLDGSLVSAFLASLKPGASGSRVFHGTTRGYLTVEVEVRSDGDGTPLTATYTLSWGGAPVPSTGGSLSPLPTGTPTLGGSPTSQA